LPDFNANAADFGVAAESHSSAAESRLVGESALDFAVDAVEPLFGTIASFPRGSDLCLQLGNPVFGGSQLIRKLLRHVERVAAIFVGNAGRP
jgi:hypothetical protein